MPKKDLIPTYKPENITKWSNIAFWFAKTLFEKRKICVPYKKFRLNNLCCKRAYLKWKKHDYKKFNKKL